MARVVHTPEMRTEGGGEGIGIVLGIIIALLLAILFFVYGLPYLQSLGNGTDLNVNVPNVAPNTAPAQ